MANVVMIVAFVRSSSRGAVEQVLRERNVSGWNESEGIGHGSAAGGRGLPNARFEIVVAKEQAATLVAAIAATVSTGQPGDGFVLTVPVLGIERLSDKSVGPSAL